jgi:hypothetical protein
MECNASRVDGNETGCFIFLFFGVVINTGAEERKNVAIAENAFFEVFFLLRWRDGKNV